MSEGLLHLLYGNCTWVCRLLCCARMLSPVRLMIFGRKFPSVLPSAYSASLTARIRFLYPPYIFCEGQNVPVLVAGWHFAVYHHPDIA